MEHTAVKILNRHGVMAISTVRPDGWPQTTMVGYANQGFDLFFLIFRASQKLANIQHVAFHLVNAVLAVLSFRTLLLGFNNDADIILGMGCPRREDRKVHPLRP